MLRGGKEHNTWDPQEEFRMHNLLLSAFYLTFLIPSLLFALYCDARGEMR